MKLLSNLYYLSIIILYLCINSPFSVLAIKLLTNTNTNTNTNLNLFAKTSQKPFKRDRTRKKLKDDKDGIELYQSYTATKAMYRPQESWFVNVMLEKPNEKYFREAEENGLKYQIESLEENLDRDYMNGVRDYYDQKLENYEQMMVQKARISSLIKKQPNIIIKYNYCKLFSFIPCNLLQTT